MTSPHAIAATALPHMLRNLSGILSKAEAQAKEKGMDLAALLQKRLAPDMHPLARQVLLALVIAEDMAARMSGENPPGMPDDLTFEQILGFMDQENAQMTFPLLRERIAATLAVIEARPAAPYAGASARDVSMTFPTALEPFFKVRDLTLSGDDFILTFALPNFYFHVSIAYAILRSNGIMLGKRDYLMG
jgi:hypothetical protein